MLFPNSYVFALAVYLKDGSLKSDGKFSGGKMVTCKST